MQFLSDLLLATGALGAAVFCFVLSRRLKALTRLDSGMGSAIAVLSRQVDDLSAALRAAQETALQTESRLQSQSVRAEAACRKLELLLASLHDLPGDTSDAADTLRAPSRWTGGPARRAAEPAAGQPEAMRADQQHNDTDSLAFDDGPAAGTRARVLRRRPQAGKV